MFMGIIDISNSITERTKGKLPVLNSHNNISKEKHVIDIFIPHVYQNLPGSI